MTITNKHTTEKLPAWKMLEGWNDLTADRKLPPDLSIAISTRRAELLQAVAARYRSDPAAYCDEKFTLLEVIELLLDTNQALQEHAAQVAERAQHVEDALESLQTNIGKLRTLADFRDPESYAGDA